jgi:hypothetical protein
MCDRDGGGGRAIDRGVAEVVLDTDVRASRQHAKIVCEVI